MLNFKTSRFIAMFVNVLIMAISCALTRAPRSSYSLNKFNKITEQEAIKHTSTTRYPPKVRLEGLSSFPG